MTGSLIDSRHTEHSSSEPLANTTRSFSIKRSRISAGVAEAPKYGVWKILSKNPSCSDTEHKLGKNITEVCGGFSQQIWVAAMLSELHQDDQNVSKIP